MSIPNSSNNGGQGTAKVGKIAEKIIEKEDHGEEFQRDFVLHIIPMCIIKRMNGDCFFTILKLLIDVNKISIYNWHACLLQCLNDIVVQWAQNQCRYFRGPPLNKAEKEFPREHGRGKTIDMIDYQEIIYESENELQTKVTHMAQENQAHNEPSASTHGSSLAPEQPCLECGSKREPQIVGPNDPIELSNNKISEMTEEDVCATLALPTGLFEDQVASIHKPTNEYTKLLRR
ncbi:hypothetical protein Cgig2_017509 [Carnegiea gigantea]|uniref:Uncharacterized protein n=1 Tax=Carnegiea gigantea TaxID=171969 RepID=A0A9Q1K421_9CARY|nr:hypothetical protein Cgig2_017509 [Carnegiea gigantea]